MATALKSLPKFFGLTAAQYAALTTKDANTLYFVFDEGVNGVIYRGSHVYGETVSYVATVPSASDALKGVIYFSAATGTAYVKSGTEMKPVGVLTVDTISDADPSQNKSVPNIGAIKGYVGNKIATVFTYKGVKDTVADLPGVVATADTKAVAGKTYYSRTGEGTPYSPYLYTVLTLAVGADVPTGSFEGPKIGDLWCVKVGEDGQSAEYAWTRLDTADPSEYKWEKLGSTIDYTIFVQKKTGATVGGVGVFDGSGDLVDSEKVISTAEEIPASTATSTAVLANEFAVAKSLEAEAATRAEVDATKQVRDTDAVQYNAAYFDAYGNTIDSGKSMGGDWFGDDPSGTVLATELGVTHYVAKKQERDYDAVENNAAMFDAYGNTIDAGFKYGTDSDVITASSDANTVATEKAVAAAVKATGDNKQDKDFDAVVGNVGIFDAYGNTIDGGKKQGGATLALTANGIVTADGAYLKNSAITPVVIGSDTYYAWTTGPSTIYTKSLTPAVGDTTYTISGSTATAGKAIIGLVTVASENILATEAAVKTVVDEEAARAMAVEDVKLDDIVGTNDNILLVAGSGTAVADSGKSISAETIVPASTSTSVNKVANELEVANLKEHIVDDYQLKDKDAVEGNVAKFDAYGNTIDTGYITGTDTIDTAAANATTLATEEAVIALVNQMAWQTVEA